MSNVFNNTRDQAEVQLGMLLEQMDVPARRLPVTRSNLRWLNRNLAIQNSDHPLFSEAQSLVIQLLRGAEKSQ